MKKRLFTVLLVFVMGLPASAQQDRLTVVATHSILADVVQNVAGDAADVTSLLPLNADPHSYTPTPRELVMLAEVDVVFVNGAFFEEGLLEGIENAATDITIVEASRCVEILPFGHHDHEEEERKHEGEDHEEHADGPCEAHHEEAHIAHHDASLGVLIDLDCGEGHEHEEEEEHEEGEEHGHEEGSCDAHVWMNPENVMLWTLTIRDALSELDPANAETYAQNTAAYIVQLSELQSELESLVQAVPEENRVLVTSHDSLGYFAARFEFEVVGVVIPGGSTVSEPSAQDLAELIDEIEEEGVSAVFAETTVAPGLVQQVAAESGASVLTLYSGSLSDADGPASTYLDYMRYNVETIVNGLG